jgi:hypothetical protein
MSVSKDVERLYNDLAYAAPEMWVTHITRRMEEAADNAVEEERERIENGILALKVSNDVTYQRWVQEKKADETDHVPHVIANECYEQALRIVNPDWNKVIIPCPHCGAELYDRHRKYHLDVPCENERCYDFKGGHWSKGTYCPDCDATLSTDIDADIIAEERKFLFGEE